MHGMVGDTTRWSMAAWSTPVEVLGLVELRMGCLAGRASVVGPQPRRGAQPVEGGVEKDPGLPNLVGDSPERRLRRSALLF
jgi:hypothetical protein